MFRIPLKRIEDNPYQTRMVYGDLTELRDAILELREVLPETSGLIQVPPARIVLDGEVIIVSGVDEDWNEFLRAHEKAMVQISVGHRRLRAFMEIAQSNAHYETFPVELRMLSDSDMADIAWAENEKRDGISDIERAVALDRAITDFKLSQTKIGERWGLSQSAVANLIRLLRLPVKVQGLIRDGDITGRHGRALLPLVDMDEKWQVFLSILGTGVPGQYRTVKELSAAVARHVRENTYSLTPDDVGFDAKWDACEKDTRICEGCKDHVKIGREWRCTDLRCRQAKIRKHKIVIQGPQKAKQTYELLRDKLNDTWLLVDKPQAWAQCSGCNRAYRDMVSTSSEATGWLQSERMMKAICPDCRERAGGLEPTEFQTEETVEEAEIAGAPTVLAQTGDTTPPAATVQVSAHTRAKPTIVLPPPTPKPHVPGPVRVTLLIMPGTDLRERDVQGSIGETGPTAFKSGKFDRIEWLLTELLEGYFPELVQGTKAADDDEAE